MDPVPQKALAVSLGIGLGSLMSISFLLARILSVLQKISDRGCR